MLTPICICLFNGRKALSYYLTDYSNPEVMLMAAIKALMRHRYHNHVIYAHNLSGFDGVFLLKLLVKLGNLKLIMREGRIIEILLTFKHGKNEFVLKFRDSLMLLPASLRALAISFDVLKKNLLSSFLS